MHRLIALCITLTAPALAVAQTDPCANELQEGDLCNEFYFGEHEWNEIMNNPAQMPCAMAQCQGGTCTQINMLNGMFCGNNMTQCGYERCWDGECSFGALLEQVGAEIDLAEKGCSKVVCGSDGYAEQITNDFMIGKIVDTANGGCALEKCGPNGTPQIHANPLAEGKTCLSEFESPLTCVKNICEQGICAFNQFVSGWSCDDGDPTTSPDTCDLGTCVGITQNCGSATAQDGDHCDDGSFCTINDRCHDGDCVGKANTCDDGNPNTHDKCDEGFGPGDGDCLHMLKNHHATRSTIVTLLSEISNSAPVRTMREHLDYVLPNPAGLPE